LGERVLERLKKTRESIGRWRNIAQEIEILIKKVGLREKEIRRISKNTFKRNHF